jgi:Gpi18-like mannosyltransferase
MEFALGTSNWQDAWVENPWHPLLFSIIVVSAYPLWRFRKYLIDSKLFYGLYALAALFFVVANEHFINNFLNVSTVLGGGYILWRLRKQLTPVTTIYGFCGIGLLLASGGTLSLSRLAYGIVPLSLALGVFLSRHPRLGYLTLGLFAILLTQLSLGFAQKLWVG